MAGYFLESFRVTVYAVFGGVLIASVICVPDWGIFKGKAVHGTQLPHLTLLLALVCMKFMQQTCDLCVQYVLHAQMRGAIRRRHSRGSPRHTHACACCNLVSPCANLPCDSLAL